VRSRGLEKGLTHISSAAADNHPEIMYVSKNCCGRSRLVRQESQFALVITALLFELAICTLETQPGDANSVLQA
jgi:hypothetical protein